ncbi:MAG: flagellar export protein FliJ [Nitrosomonas sp.]
MPKKPSLKLLLDLVQQQTDASAKRLGKLNFQHQEAEKKLNLLMQYRQSYQSHFQDSKAKGIDHIEWHNFMAFMAKLDAAVNEQRQVVLHAHNKKIVGSNEFMSYQRKLKSYETLSQRHQDAENKHQIKQEQKLQDEFSANALRHDSFSSKNDE